jgi:deoxyribodipyrimidine photo-lyase
LKKPEDMKTLSKPLILLTISAISLFSCEEPPRECNIPSKEVAQGIIRNYDKNRNFPSVAGTSKLGIHFRFGTISIREKARKAMPLNETFLNELIWRDFYSQILQEH